MGSIIARIEDFVKHRRDTLWRLAVVLLIGWSSYNVGLIRSRPAGTALSEPPVRIRESIVSQTPSAGRGSVQRTNRNDLRVVVSKTAGSKKYHHSWCASAARIKEENRLWYPSAQAAQADGYSLAGNCSE